MILADIAPIPDVDPMEWARAIAYVGWPAVALAALYIVCRWPPWRRTKPKGGEE